MHISRRRIGGLLTVLAMLVTPLAAGTVITAAPASASCTKSCLNYTDPKTTGCWDKKAYSLIQGTDWYGNTLQLWWSPDCQTNWAQIHSGSTNPTKLWTETQDGRGTYVYEFSGYVGWAWSDQLYAPTTKARACEDEQLPSGLWGPVSCVGQY